MTAQFVPATVTEGFIVKLEPKMVMGEPEVNTPVWGTILVTAGGE